MRTTDDLGMPVFRDISRTVLRFRAGLAFVRKFCFQLSRIISLQLM